MVEHCVPRRDGRRLTAFYPGHACRKRRLAPTRPTEELSRDTASRAWATLGWQRVQCAYRRCVASHTRATTRTSLVAAFPAPNVKLFGEYVNVQSYALLNFINDARMCRSARPQRPRRREPRRHRWRKHRLLIVPDRTPRPAHRAGSRPENLLILSRHYQVIASLPAGNSKVMASSVRTAPPGISSR